MTPAERAERACARLRHECGAVPVDCDRCATQAAIARDIEEAVAEANAVAASRVSGDPAVRDLLLDEFGTTDPELLKDEINKRRAALHAIWADRDRLRGILVRFLARVHARERVAPIMEPGLRHEQEQDEANALRWWNEHSDETKMRIWGAIQAMGKTTEEEIISRFAQIGFTHIALLAEEASRG